MKKYRIRYDAPKNYGISYETIEARGLVHAFTLAKAHLKDIRKITNNPKMTIGKVEQEREDV
jgi:hypothetical protein